MTTGWSERVRELADREYVRPAKRDRCSKVSIVIGDIQRKLRAEGFPAGYTNQICSSLESEKFWGTRGLQMRSSLGQPRRHSTTFEFLIEDGGPALGPTDSDPLLDLMGSLKGAIREGADAFVRELRRDKGISR